MSAIDIFYVLGLLLVVLFWVRASRQANMVIVHQERRGEPSRSITRSKLHALRREISG